jgi:integrase
VTAALALPAHGALAAGEALHEADEAARRYASLALAPRTMAAYTAAWRAFGAWCAPLALDVLPAAPSTVASYIASQAARGIAPASIDLALAAISAAHEIAGLASPRSAPEVRLVRKGLRRDRGTAQRQAAELTPAQLRAIVAACDTRDRALLLLGFASALRRSELVALDVGDVRFVDGGLDVHLRRSKTDQEGRGRSIDVHPGAHLETCPVRALRAWLGDRTSGPLFTSAAGVRLADRDVARILKRAAKRAGVEGEFSGHSLRAGHVTAAARAGAQRADICAVTGHKPEGRMVERYERAAKRFTVNTMAGIL